MLRMILAVLRLITFWDLFPLVCNVDKVDSS